mgnify:CR=1 FL=1
MRLLTRRREAGRSGDGVFADDQVAVLLATFPALAAGEGHEKAPVLDELLVKGEAPGFFERWLNYLARSP